MQDEMKPQVQQPQVDNSEGQMARADLYRGAKNAMKLFQMVQDGQQLEGWVQAKITKAADYLDSVYHYMEYQAKFGQGGVAISLDDITSDAAVSSKQGAVSEEDDEKEIKESMNYEQKLQALLEGAKKEQADKKKLPSMAHVKKMCQDGKSVAEICKMHPNCDQKELKQMVADCKKKLAEGKTEVQYDKDGKRTGVKHTSTHKYTDEPHTEPKSQVKAKSAAEKAGEKAADKAQAKDSKDYEKKNPGSVKRYKDGKLVSEDAESKKAEEEKRKKEEKKKKMAKIMDEAKKPDDDGDGVPDWADKKPGKDDHADKKPSTSKGLSDKQKKLPPGLQKAIAKKSGGVKESDTRAPTKSKERTDTLPSGTKVKTTTYQGWQSQAADKAADKAKKDSMKESVTESADLMRMRQLMKRLNG